MCDETAEIARAATGAPLPLTTAAPATAAKADKVEICHFSGHGDEAQPDFILDLELDEDERVEECISRNGRVLSVNGNAVSYDSDDVRRGHEVDTPEPP